MSKQLIINQTLNECRAALIENGEILDFLMERTQIKKQFSPHGNVNSNPSANNTPNVTDGYTFPFVGDIFKGKVVRVLPGMQSAFVDIGFEKAAFLYVDDAYLPTLDEQREMAEKSRIAQAELKNRHGEVIPDELSTLSEAVNMRFRPEVNIESFLKEGDEILVQVSKEPISTKGPRVTRHITFAGRHIVFMPLIEHTGVSRRIESEKERERLKDILDTIRPTGTGVIARTVAEGQSYKVLKYDYNILVKLWKDVLKRSEKSRAPVVVHQDLSFIQRVLRDITDEDVDEIILDSKENLKEAEKFVGKFLPSMKGKFKLHTNNEIPIFEKFAIDLEIERAIDNKVFLKSGGSLNIDQTEALVSIDVNTGKFIGRKTFEETILKTNLEAVKEIAYQLRLRNCGGIIIIDFIDMEKEENRQTVYNALCEALKKDRAKTNVLPISGLGLVEMTRKRTRDTLSRIMCGVCPYCEGTGRVKSTLTVCFEIIRELNKVLAKSKGPKVFIYAHPEVAATLTNEDYNLIETLEEAFGKTIVIRSENNYHIEQYEIFPQEF